MQSISATDLNMALKQTKDDWFLLDVREPFEFAICHIEGAVNISMREVSARFTEIKNHKLIVCICHHGVRSLQVCQYLESLSVSGIYNLQGGIDAWAREVDVTMPRY